MPNENPNIEVCFAVYQRPHRVPEILEQLKRQTIQNFNVNIWNNSGQELDISAFPADRIQVVDSGKNEGSQARFRLVPKTKGDPIIFFDDDEELDDDFVEYHYWIYKPNAIQGWWTRIFYHYYWHSKHHLPAGTEVDYVGTGGMVLGRRIFDEEPILQAIPDQFAKMEDLFLAFIAKQRRMKLISAEQKCRILDDGKDQFRGIAKEKDDAFAALRKEGFPLVEESCDICRHRGGFKLYREKDNWHPINIYRCPNCLSSERHRAVWRLVKEKEKSGLEILHISPEKGLRECLKGLGNYVSIDFPPRESETSDVVAAELNMDLRKMEFNDNGFDLIVCNHVLDYIQELDEAIKELYRILSIGGRVYITVPIYEEKTKKLDSPVINHWWRCGLDFKNILEKAGFEVKVEKEYGEYVFVCEKKWKLNFRNAVDKAILAEEMIQNTYRVNNPAMVVDIGAHIGGTALYCANLGAEVHAYEPEKENYCLMEKNVFANKLADKIKMFPIAIGNQFEKEDRFLCLHEDNSGCHSFNSKNAPGMGEKKQMVNVIPIQNVFKNIDHCDLLKIDCEGAEYEFLRDIPFDKVGHISMELHDGDQIGMIDFLRTKFPKVDYHTAKDGRSLMVYCEKDDIATSSI